MSEATDGTVAGGWQPLRRGPSRAVGTTVDKILAMLHDGRWKPGSRLPPQREFAALLDVSRATLREALSILLTTGKIAPREGGRGFVFTDPADQRREPGWPSAARYSLKDVFQFRHVMEGYVAQMAAVSRTADNIAALRASLDDFRAAACAGALMAYAEADFAFHAQIVAMAGNLLFCDMHGAFAGVMLESQRLTAWRPGDLWAAVKEHEAILEAIERGDPDGAGYYMRKHINMGGSRSGLALSELP